MKSKKSVDLLESKSNEMFPDPRTDVNLSDVTLGPRVRGKNSQLLACHPRLKRSSRNLPITPSCLKIF